MVGAMEELLYQSFQLVAQGEENLIILRHCFLRWTSGCV